MATYTVNEANKYHLIIETGIQGPPGPPGTGTLAQAIVQDVEPTSGTTGDMWFNDSTDILKIYANGVWQTQTLDDEWF